MTPTTTQFLDGNAKAGDAPFERQILVDRADYRLPNRDTRPGWVKVLVTIAGTAFGIMFFCFWVVVPVAQVLAFFKQNLVPGWWMIAPALLGLLLLYSIGRVVMIASAIVRNRTYAAVRLTHDQLACEDRAYLVRSRRKLAVAKIRRLVVIDGLFEIKDNPPRHKVGFQPSILALANLAEFESHLVAETQSGHFFMIACGYPKPILLSLAQDLAPRIESAAPSVQAPIQRGTELSIDSTAGIPIVDTEHTELNPVGNRPEQTAVEIDYRDDGITVQVPRTRDWTGATFIRVFATLWNAGSWFLLINLFAEIQNDKTPIFLLIPFVVVGAGLILYILHQSTCETTIATSDDLLFIKSTSRIRTRQREWQRQQIVRICVDDSGTEYNEEPVKELQIHPLGENKFGCLSQLSIAELEWISSQLNRVFDIHPEQEPGYAYRDSENRPIPVHSSRVSVEHTANETVICLPGRSTGGVVAGFVFASVFWIVGLIVMVVTFTAQIDETFAKVFLFVWSTTFMGFGLANCIYLLLFAKTRFELRVSEKQLVISRNRWWQHHQQTYANNTLDPMQVCESSYKINGKPSFWLPIQSDNAKPIKIAQGRTEDDLKLVATIINEKMKL